MVRFPLFLFTGSLFKSYTEYRSVKLQRKAASDSYKST
jgi:hypothetical protein